MSKGLEALKNHKLVLKALGHKNCEEWENLKVIEKELEALEIIKTLKDVDFIIDYDEEHDCWVLSIECEYDRLQIASGYGKDKYDLLKEVLQ